MEIRDLNHVESFYQGMNEPEGYGAFDQQETDPCDTCDLKDQSECCNAPIIMHDICSRCGEHTISCCYECEFNYKNQ